jgi:hypothetical protein
MTDVYDAGEPKREADKETHKKRLPTDYSEVLRKMKTSKNPWGSLIARPRYFRTEVQQEGEQILLLMRKHPITNLGWMAVALLMIVVIFGARFLPFWDDLTVPFQIMTLILWLLMITAVILEGFLKWYFDVFIVTDERIIDIDFYHLVYKNITSTKIDNIQDVTYNISGAFQSLLNYGQVLIQTAGTGVKMVPQQTVPTMEMWNTPTPALVAKLINELIVEEEQEKLEGRAR